MMTAFFTNGQVMQFQQRTLSVANYHAQTDNFPKMLEPLRSLIVLSKVLTQTYAPVAQRIRAAGFYPACRRFDSCPGYQVNKIVLQDDFYFSVFSTQQTIVLVKN